MFLMLLSAAVVTAMCRNGLLAPNDGLDFTDCDTNKYLHNGFTYLQAVLDTVLIAVSNESEKPFIC